MLINVTNLTEVLKKITNDNKFGHKIDKILICKNNNSVYSFFEFWENYVYINHEYTNYIEQNFIINIGLDDIINNDIIEITISNNIFFVNGVIVRTENYFPWIFNKRQPICKFDMIENKSNILNITKKAFENAVLCSCDNNTISFYCINNTEGVRIKYKCEKYDNFKFEELISKDNFQFILSLIQNSQVFIDRCENYLLFNLNNNIIIATSIIKNEKKELIKLPFGGKFMEKEVELDGLIDKISFFYYQYSEQSNKITLEIDEEFSKIKIYQNGIKNSNSKYIKLEKIAKLLGKRLPRKAIIKYNEFQMILQSKNVEIAFTLERQK